MIYIVIRKKDRKVMQIKNIKEVQDGYSHHNGFRRFSAVRPLVRMTETDINTVRFV